MADHEPLEFEACAVCERTLLIGERSFDYVTSSGGVQGVCALCKSRAEASGWVPAGFAGSATSHAPRARRRFALRDRNGRRTGSRERVEAPAGDRFMPSGGGAQLTPPPALSGQAPPALARSPGSAHEQEEPSTGATSGAVVAPAEGAEPTEKAAAVDATPDESEPELTHETIIDRAIGAFNAAAEQQQVSSLRRTLGDPRVSVSASEEQTVVVVVAWELSWYEWEVRVDDGVTEVVEVRKGGELAELGEPQPEWNGALDEESRLTLAAA